MLCPICKKTALMKYRPFCSPRCQQIDLLNWLNETYKIETDDSSVPAGSPYIDEIDDNEKGNKG